MEKLIIRKIFQVASGRKLITIPKGSSLKKGDYVFISKVENKSEGTSQ